jgi:hypothetical protein
MLPTIFFVVYGAYLTMEIIKCKLVEVSHVDFQQTRWNGLWGTWKIQLIATCKLGFITDIFVCCWKSELLDKICENFPYRLCRISVQPYERRAYRQTWPAHKGFLSLSLSPSAFLFFSLTFKERLMVGGHNILYINAYTLFQLRCILIVSLRVFILTIDLIAVYLQ